MNIIKLTWGEECEEFENFQTKWREKMMFGIYLTYSEERIQQEIIKAYLDEEDLEIDNHIKE